MAALHAFRSTLKSILHLHESPSRTALAFALGVFIAFSPTYGLHLALAVFVSWAFRLNFLALMAGNLINNPWTFVPILGATMWTGFQLLGMPDVPAFVWNDLSPGVLYQQLIPYAGPFLIGGFTLSLLSAALAYPMAYWVISRYRTGPEPCNAEERLPI